MTKGGLDGMQQREAGSLPVKPRRRVQSGTRGRRGDRQRSGPSAMKTALPHGIDKGSDMEIEYCKIFPPVGFARVGDSNDPKDDFFIGPEWVGQRLSANPSFKYKDNSGRVKRQAVRFRIYGFDKHNRAICELTAREADITWTLSLANRKASWFRFNGAKNACLQFRDKFPEVDPETGRSNRRNAQIGIQHSEERASKGGRNVQDLNSEERTRLLDIDPPYWPKGGSTGTPPHARTVSGCNVVSSTDEPLDFVGSFLGKKEVYLGEIRTDEAGRLIVLGGRGNSEWISHPAIDDLDAGWIRHYANNDGWHDDVSDGPVSATVKLKDSGGKSYEAKDGAWVIVTPPDFAPDSTNLITAHDVMYEVAVEQGWKKEETETEF